MANAASAKQESTTKFSEPPRYKLLEKAFFGAVKVRRGRDWLPLEDVLLDPEAQPLENKLNGPFDNKEGGERVALEIEFEGIPDDHMEALNDAANWMMDNVDALKEKARLATPQTKRRRRDPVDALTVMGAGATVLRPVGDSV